MSAQRLRRPWSNVYPRLLTSQRIASAAGASSIHALWEQLERAPFFLKGADRDAWTSAFLTRYPNGAAAVVAAADLVCRLLLEKKKNTKETRRSQGPTGAAAR